MNKAQIEKATRVSMAQWTQSQMFDGLNIQDRLVHTETVKAIHVRVEDDRGPITNQKVSCTFNFGIVRLAQLWKTQIRIYYSSVCFEFISMLMYTL